MKANIYQKPLKDGRKHLYIRYLSNGRQCVKMLGLYLTGDKHADAVTMKKAKSVTAQMQTELNANTLGVWLQTYQAKMARTKSNSTAVILGRLCALYDAFASNRPTIAINELNAATIADFAAYLSTANVSDKTGRLSNNTQRIYLRWLCSALTDAANSGLIDFETATKATKAINAHKPKATQTERGFLTDADKQQLFNTPRPNAAYCAAFEFATLTGLRYSDIRRVSPDMVKNGRLCLIMQKTKSVLAVKLTARAAELLQEHAHQWRKMPICTAEINYYLAQWCIAANIEPVTIHTGRHTFATELLNRGANLKTIQGLLGHRSINTTQIYAELIDETKDAAIDLLQ